MSTDDSAASQWSFDVTALLTAVVGVLIVGYGLLVVPASVVGGAWIAAIGLSILLSGLFDTEWAGDRAGLTTGDRRRLSFLFGGLAVVLAVAFVVSNV